MVLTTYAGNGERRKQFCVLFLHLQTSHRVQLDQR
jgi:hypothetical protein